MKELNIMNFVSRQNELLFYKADINAVVDAQSKKATGEIQGIDPDRLLNTPVDDLVAYIADKYRIEVPALHRGGALLDDPPPLFRAQGAKLIGLYDSQISFGQDRVLLVWTRLIMANGRSRPSRISARTMAKPFERSAASSSHCAASLICSVLRASPSTDRSSRRSMRETRTSPRPR
jgi:hypothetical protein